MYIARMIFAYRRMTSSRETLNTRFQSERDRIRALLRRCDGDKASRRMLIQRVRGLEDSSRHWSVWMTLDHLRIVHHEIARLIGTLAQGKVPEGTTSTAAVKPTTEVNADIVDAYEQSCDAVLAVVAASPNLKTTVRYPHPWFGPLTAAGRHALAVGHLKIHRKQVERIVGGLRDG
ncbi:MAG TPA: DinB family protein [Gemmataceae bacterium]|nr:DinB family protein [Gemmataceae bacterium]